MFISCGFYKYFYFHSDVYCNCRQTLQQSSLENNNVAGSNFTHIHFQESFLYAIKAK